MDVLKRLWTFLALLYRLITLLFTNAQSWKYFCRGKYTNPSLRNLTRNLGFFKYNYVILLMSTLIYNFLTDKYLYFVLLLMVVAFLLYDEQQGYSQFFSLFYAFFFIYVIMFLSAADLQRLKLTEFLSAVIIVLHAFCKRSYYHRNSRQRAYYHRNSQQRTYYHRNSQQRTYYHRSSTNQLRGSGYRSRQFEFHNDPILCVCVVIFVVVVACLPQTNEKLPNYSFFNSSLINSTLIYYACNTSEMCCNNLEKHIE